MKLAVGFSLISLLAAGIAPAAAQSFGSGSDVAPAVSDAAEPLAPFAAPSEKNAALPAAPSAENAELAAELAEIDPSIPVIDKKTLPPEEQDLFLPQDVMTLFSRKTEDGSKRGGVNMIEMDKEGRPRKAEKIFLYYDDFQISRSIGGLTSCDVKFFVTTNLDRKLISLDAKLIWPGITTSVSFANVAPNTPNYYPYTLIGDGCYTMDKMPNIVVNRCRVRGMNSADCAAKITWIKKVK